MSCNFLKNLIMKHNHIYNHITDRDEIIWCTSSGQKFKISELANLHLERIVEYCKNLYISSHNNISEIQSGATIYLRGNLILDENFIDFLELELMYRKNNNIVIEPVPYTGPYNLYTNL